MRHDAKTLQADSSSVRAETEHLAGQLQRVVVVRLIGILSFLAAFFLLRIFFAEPSAGADVAPTEVSTTAIDRLIYGLLTLGIVINVGFLVQLRRARTLLRTQAVIQFSSDLALIAVLVYFFGGATSPFSSLFFVVIILAAAFLGQRAGLVTAAAAWILFAFAALARKFAWLPWAPAADDPLSEVLYRLLLHLAGFLLVALLTSKLAQELRWAQRDLAALQGIHRDIVESIPSGLVTFSPDGTVVTANAASPKILLRPDEDFVGRSVMATGLFEDTPWQEYAAAGSADRRRFEVSLRDGDEARPIGFSLNELTSQAGEPVGYVLIFQDLSEWRKLQEELQLKDRMAAVGEMAAGIAHEIGNPLAALSGSAQMLQPSLAEGSSQRTLLDIILRESRRLDRIIKSFLQFSRPRDRSSMRFDIAELLRDNTELLRNSEEVLPGHQIHLELAEASAPIIADADQVSQIFWNLTRNALRAMDTAGDLFVHGRLRGDVYCIGFRDTGRGMTVDERSGLFYPFHTSFRGGTGIGMAIVYRIIEEHGGRLTVDSEAGRGTLIEVELPVVESALAAAP